MLRLMMGINIIKKTSKEEIRARSGVSEKIREARLRWLGNVERETGVDVSMRKWKLVGTDRWMTKTEVERCYMKTHRAKHNTVEHG